MKKIKNLNSFNKKQKQINTLENKVQVLENVIKDKLYKSFISKLDEPIENQRLKRENKRLRQQVKSLKEIIKEGK